MTADFVVIGGGIIGLPLALEVRRRFGDAPTRRGASSLASGRTNGRCSRPRRRRWIADTIARDFGFSADYRILPFKGVYLYADDGEALRAHVYPVPNLRSPFLGVHFTVLAAELVTGVEPGRYRRWGDPGIRAQLLNLRARKLEMDFRYEGNEKSFHGLNAVSPAFTCALPSSRYLVNEIEQLVR